MYFYTFIDLVCVTADNIVPDRGISSLKKTALSEISQNVTHAISPYIVVFIIFYC